MTLPLSVEPEQENTGNRGTSTRKSADLQSPDDLTAASWGKSSGQQEVMLVVERGEMVSMQETRRSDTLIPPLPMAPPPPPPPLQVTGSMRVL